VSLRVCSRSAQSESLRLASAQLGVVLSPGLRAEVVAVTRPDHAAPGGAVRSSCVSSIRCGRRRSRFPQLPAGYGEREGGDGVTCERMKADTGSSLPFVVSIGARVGFGWSAPQAVHRRVHINASTLAGDTLPTILDWNQDGLRLGGAERDDGDGRSVAGGLSPTRSRHPC